MKHLDHLPNLAKLLNWDVKPLIECESKLRTNSFARNFCDVVVGLQENLDETKKIITSSIEHLFDSLFTSFSSDDSLRLSHDLINSSMLRLAIAFDLRIVFLGK